MGYPRHSESSPFYGVQTAFVPYPSLLAELDGTPVPPEFVIRQEWQQSHVRSCGPIL
ncbi:MAG TPA: hypothetical protein VGF01_07580 [Terracidiphilus sp.]